LATGILFAPAPASAQYEPGRGSLGGTMGAPLIFSTSELRAGQRPRLIGKPHFQYVLNQDWRVSMRFGFGWLGYSEKQAAPFPLQAYNHDYTTISTRADQLDVVVPITATMSYVRNLNSSGSWKGFAGAGLGMYWVNLLNDRHTIFDPASHERFVFWSPGLGGELGAEYFVPANKSVSLEGVTTFHYLMESHRGVFPSGYSGHYGFFDISFGVNVYFDLSRGERKVAPAPEPGPKLEGGAEPAPSQPQTPPETPPTPPPYPKP
jgi:hypothetical protein